LSLEQFLAVIAAGISLGMGWASVRYFMDKKFQTQPQNGNGNGAKYEAISIEIQALKVLLLGVQGQGGLVMEIRDLRLSKHDVGNSIQTLQNKMYVIEQRVNQIDIRMDEK
jgi:hypothetical protein